MNTPLKAAIGIATLVSLSALAIPKKDDLSLAEALGWLWSPQPYNVCPGHFHEPDDIARVLTPKPVKTAATTITTTGPVIYSGKGTSQLQGIVTIDQPGRRVSANNVSLKRDPTTKQINRASLAGHIHYYEAGKLLLGEQADLRLDNHYVRVENAAYRLSHQTTNETLTAWGRASFVERYANKNMELHHATYTTCPPGRCVWQLRAKRIDIDNIQQKGVAHHVTFHLWRIPIFYTPYLSFPLNHERKSGFLIPSFGYSDANGMEFELPYYFNLAPNYDATLSVQSLAKRGLQIMGNGRYLSSRQQGNFSLQVLANDQAFRHFKQDAPDNIGANPVRLPYLSRIKSASLNRYAFYWQHQIDYDANWRATMNLNRVSDDYYLHDFGNNPVTSNQDQLLNEAALHYSNAHWDFMARAQVYQTLHPLDSLAKEPYNRVPQCYLHAFYPKRLLGFDLELTGDYNFFDHRRDFFSNQNVVTGSRLQLQPAIHLPWQNSAAYFIPTLRLDLTKYWLTDQATGVAREITRSLPIAHIDTGFFLEHPFQCYHHHYRQTIEPRAYYLLVPKLRQEQIPIFDTALPNFNTEQLFYYNRFTGHDRISDANQVSLSVTSRLLNDDDGRQLVHASIGSIYYIQLPQLQLNDTIVRSVNNVRSHFSPIIGMLDLNVDTNFGMTGVWAWNPRDNSTDNAMASLHYKTDQSLLFNVSYEFVREGDIARKESNNNLSRLNLSTSLPMGRWQLWGNWNYNLSHRHPQSYFLGIGYESCCWGIRTVLSRTVLETNLEGGNHYDNKVFLQVKFKGLGTVGNSDPSHLLETGITGYQDHFRNNGSLV